MNITTVNASVRFSRKVDESHVTIELSAAADLSPQESQNWQQAQATLYSDLTEQIKALWPKPKSNGNGHSGEKEQTAHYCNEHGLTFQRYEKNGRSWYAHKHGGEWCNER